MIRRTFWLNRIIEAWKSRPIVWLSGVRRTGKTTIAKMFHEAFYCNCDLPSMISRIEDTEFFFSSVQSGSMVVFDEVHRVPDPSLLLKIGADEFPHLKILATGSSTLAATRKFRDSLTGRKKTIYLPPVLWSECQKDFAITDFNHRLLFGGLPEPLLSAEKNPDFFAEWIDGFYARDLSELFSIKNRTGFLKLLRLVFSQSGGILEYGSLAAPCSLSLPTVHTYIESMLVSHALFLIPPFHGGGTREIVKRPKVYCFDTGFVTYINGWDTIRNDDRGLLWEHLVLDELRAMLPEESIHYWRDKSAREIDFVLPLKPPSNICAIECKINPDQFNSAALLEFRKAYPEGRNFIVAPFVKSPYPKRYGEIVVNVCGSTHLRTELSGSNE